MKELLSGKPLKPKAVAKLTKQIEAFTEALAYLNEAPVEEYYKYSNVEFSEEFSLLAFAVGDLQAEIVRTVKKQF